MMVTSVPTESSRTYRSIACTEEGSKGTLARLNPDQEEEQSTPQAWHCSRRLPM